jgi:hypothetical protein
VIRTVTLPSFLPVQLIDFSDTILRLHCWWRGCCTPAMVPMATGAGTADNALSRSFCPMEVMGIKA